MRFTKHAMMILLAVGSFSCLTPAQEEQSDLTYFEALTTRFPDLAPDYVKFLKEKKRLPDSFRISSALVEAGQAESAVKYLEELRSKADLDVDMKDALDFELAQALVAQSESANVELERKLLDRAIATYQSFLKKQPDHENSVDARNALASVSLSRGRKLSMQAEFEANAEKKKQLSAQAVEIFTAVQKELAGAIKIYDTKLEELKENPTPKAKRKARGKVTPVQRLTAAKITAQLNQAICYFYIAKSHPPKSKERTSNFDQAALQFDEIFQRHRDGGGNLPLIAHYWSAKTVFELGKPEDAMDIIDEILVSEPPPGANASLQQREFFAEVSMLAFEAMSAAGKQQAMLTQPEHSPIQWVRDHARERNASHFVGVQLAAVKLDIWRAEQQKDEGRKRAIMVEAMNRLNKEVLSRSTPYSAEAFKLRDQYAQFAEMAGGKANEFDESLFAARNLLTEKKFDEAIEKLKAATEASNEKTKPEDKARAQHLLTLAYLQARKLDETIVSAKTFADQFGSSKLVAEVAGFDLMAKFSKYSDAISRSGPSKITQTLGNEVKASAEHIEKNWPSVTQADSARLLRGTVAQSEGDLAGAAQAFNSVSTESNQYADAQWRAALASWLNYSNTLALPKTDDAQKKLQELADATRKHLDTALKAMAKAGDTTSAAVINARVLDAEVVLRTKGAKDATPAIDELVKITSDEKAPPELAPAATKLSVLALEAAIGRQDLDAADKLLDQVLKKLGNDAPKLARVFYELGKGFEQQIKQHESAGHADDAKKTRDMFTSFLDRLNSRELQFANRVYVADSYHNLAIYDRAADAYSKLLDLFKDEAGLPEILKGETNAANRQRELGRIRSRLAGSWRLSGDSAKLNSALELIEKAIAEQEQGKTYPLANLMERARIFQAMGQSDPTKLQRALVEWNRIAQRLQSPNRPPEYFECRLMMAEVLRDQKKAKDAIRVLTSTIAQFPQCGGPEMKARYQALLTELGQPRLNP